MDSKITLNGLFCQSRLGHIQFVGVLPIFPKNPKEMPLRSKPEGRFCLFLNERVE